MTDPIADMLNRIKNAQAVKKESVEVPFSTLKMNIAQILEKEGFVAKAERKGRKSSRFLEVFLKYEEDGLPTIAGVKRVSRPGQRITSPSKNIRAPKGGHGVSIISTSMGLMTNREARQKGVGGEVLCEIW
ncbi:MAG: 30S ribosomal protein S8 [bacterium]|nr:30S ribosomal protein S8 [bacterium]